MGSFGLFFRKLRKNSRFSGEDGAIELADKIGVSRATIYNWEKSTRVPPSLEWSKLSTYFSKNLELSFYQSKSEIFAKKLRILMRDHGVTQLAMAKLFGVSHPTVHGWLSGARPRPKRLSAIADFFGVSVESLLNDDQAQRESSTESLRKLVIRLTESSLLEMYLTPLFILNLSYYAEATGRKDINDVVSVLSRLRCELEAEKHPIAPSKTDIIDFKERLNSLESALNSLSTSKK